MVEIGFAQLQLESARTYQVKSDVAADRILPVSELSVKS